VTRITTRVLPVRESPEANSINLAAGTVLCDYEIVRHEGSEHPYVAQFCADGKRYSCPLYEFLPRTAIVARVPAAEESHAGASLTAT